MKKTIKPCPFCGHEPTIMEHNEMHVIWCTNPECIAHFTKSFKTREEVIKAWNRREKDE